MFKIVYDKFSSIMSSKRLITLSVNISIIQNIHSGLIIFQNIYIITPKKKKIIKNIYYDSSGLIIWTSHFVIQCMFIFLFFIVSAPLPLTNPQRVKNIFAFKRGNNFNLFHSVRICITPRDKHLHLK